MTQILSGRLRQARQNNAHVARPLNVTQSSGWSMCKLTRTCIAISLSRLSLRNRRCRALARTALGIRVTTGSWSALRTTRASFGHVARLFASSTWTQECTCTARHSVMETQFQGSRRSQDLTIEHQRTNGSHERGCTLRRHHHRRHHRLRHLRLLRRLQQQCRLRLPLHHSRGRRLPAIQLAQVRRSHECW